ncbi:hypothetical protein Acr_11g0013340 [Actinidia rufa]|uniref:Uncharacterized protein n=1 Tax=Actinidia rufa TaxID=165716 RepID=A0A7J0FED1_9ERIC|nr:hypothetical protein Acr_11g0013340 [Actinidia rufa]
MDVGNWCNSGRHGHAGWSRGFSETEHDNFSPFNTVATGSKVPVWRQLWRKIKREKRKIFECYSSTVQINYDPYAYAQNFDEGSSSWDDFDDLSRSFSARFAVPARIFEKSEEGMMD